MAENLAPKTEPSLHMQSRLGFVLGHTVRVLWYLALADTLTLCVLRFGPPSISEADHVLSQPVIWQCAITWLHWLKFAVLQLNVTYSAIAAATVALRLYEPEDWAPLNGPWLEAYTLRKLWG